MKLFMTECRHCSGIIRSDIDYCHHCGKLVLSLPAHPRPRPNPVPRTPVRVPVSGVDESRIMQLHLSGIVSLLMLITFVLFFAYFMLAGMGITEASVLPFLVAYVVLYVANMISSGMWFRLKGKSGGFLKGCVLAWLLQVIIAAYVFYCYCRDVLKNKDYS